MRQLLKEGFSAALLKCFDLHPQKSLISGIPHPCTNHQDSNPWCAILVCLQPAAVKGLLIGVLAFEKVMVFEKQIYDASQICKQGNIGTN